MQGYLPVHVLIDILQHLNELVLNFHYALLGCLCSKKKAPRAMG